jgi:hypothetical protein
LPHRSHMDGDCLIAKLRVQYMATNLLEVAL